MAVAEITNAFLNLLVLEDSQLQSAKMEWKQGHHSREMLYEWSTFKDKFCVL